MNEMLLRDDRSSNHRHLPDPSEYSLTVGEASSLMQVERCKFASVRKVQRLCREGAIDCYKLTYSREGQPVTEWLVNERSQRERIEQHEAKLDEGVRFPDPSSPSVLSDPAATGTPDDGSGNASDTPNAIGDATSLESDDQSLSVEPNAMAMPDETGNASKNGTLANDVEEQAAAVASPNPSGDARPLEPSKAELMIENAKLTAELEGKRALISKYLDDEGFLREELRDARAGRKDVTKIAERMLEALETMALGGKFNRLAEHALAVAPPEPFDPSKPSPSRQDGTAPPVNTEPPGPEDFRI